MSQPHVTHELIKHENGDLELRTSIRLDEVHTHSTMLKDDYTVFDVKYIMRVNRQVVLNESKEE